MNLIGPIIIIFEALWILILLIRINGLKKFSDQMVGYLAAITSNENILAESLATISLSYGLEPEEAAKILEEKSNESKNMQQLHCLVLTLHITAPSSIDCSGSLLRILFVPQTNRLLLSQLKCIVKSVQNYNL